MFQLPTPSPPYSAAARASMGRQTQQQDSAARLAALSARLAQYTNANSTSTTAATATATSTITAASAVSHGSGKQEQSPNTFLFRLAVMLFITYFVKSVLSLFEYVLNLALYSMVLGAVVSFVRPGPKDGPMLMMLGYLEATVNPVYVLVVENATRILGGPILAVLNFIKFNTSAGAGAANGGGPALVR
ncbi:hypothetical protein LPJ66_001464 [Kickxella alabastrina]|uniref:Uncharacterized protein n=1 Tax=Kickxella alabastrina TaxID=61397 RepID=A0ACC1IT57_9FUNG|nr:hypothetical protein LPJ66_001464 [Kickxella alabastrina]